MILKLSVLQPTRKKLGMGVGNVVKVGSSEGIGVVGTGVGPIVGRRVGMVVGPRVGTLVGMGVGYASIFWQCM